MVLLLLIGCACGRPPEPGKAAPSAAPSAPAAPKPMEAPPGLIGNVLSTSCEPSALVRTADGFLLGDNEDEEHLYAFDDTMALKATRALPTRVEDIEAIALLGGSLVVVGSHSRNRSGKAKPDRHRILMADGRVFAVDTTNLPDADALDIEGAIGLNDTLVLGLRAPLAAGLAQLLVVDTGAAAGRIERVVPIDLGGAGVRELTPYRSGFLVISGPSTDRPVPFGLWWMANLDTAPVKLDVSLPTSSEGAWLSGSTTLRVVVDGDGEPGACSEPGRYWDVELERLEGEPPG